MNHTINLLSILTALAIPLAALTARADEPVATLCPVALTNATAVLYGPAPQYVRSPEGVVYKFAWSAHTVPNSTTHTNLPAIVSLPTGKSAAIAGISDPNQTLIDHNYTRCTQIGEDLPTETEDL